jgi:hypothetical protein
VALAWLTPPVGGESMSIMYGTLLRKYEAVKDDYGLISKR